MDESSAGRKLPKSRAVVLYDLPEDLPKTSTYSGPPKKVGSAVARAGSSEVVRDEPSPPSGADMGPKQRRPLPSPDTEDSQ